ncbi:MAG: hypothetical protein H0X27_03485 [Caulobacteraceae bacterium]|nr:hypothetical protein [Caulobacteraceae bacterium]
MIVATALAIALSGHAARGQIERRHLASDGWSIRLYRDTFTGALSCSLASKTMRFRRDALIFHLGHPPDTTHAYFRIDGAPARPVAEGFSEVQARGFFPRRGWIDDPTGGDVALPAAWMQGAKRIDIRASWRTRPRKFDISRFAEALSAARAAGCSERAL